MTSDILLSLATEPKLSHAAICRLGRTIETWCDQSETETARLANEIAIPVRHLKTAMALRSGARERAGRCRERARSEGVSLRTWSDADYPAAFRQLELPPVVLWIRGQPDALPRFGSEPAVSIVGSRRASRHGQEVAELFGRDLSEAGVVIVSGFARGIDASAHRGALAGRTPTLAVLGCGIGIDYPRGHRPLADQVTQRGALISEFGIDRPPRAWCFPVRNRLIAALAQLTLVVEATVRSGSLITARLALDLGREVWAVPGRVFDPGSGGTNALIRDGAHPALTPAELLEGLHLVEPGGRTGDRLEPSSGPVAPAIEDRSDLTPEARQLLAELTPSDSLTADELIRLSDLSLDVVFNTLLDLELLRLVERQPGGGYRRRLATSN